VGGINRVVPILLESPPRLAQPPRAPARVLGGVGQVCLVRHEPRDVQQQCLQPRDPLGPGQVADEVHHLARGRAFGQQVIERLARPAAQHHHHGLIEHLFEVGLTGLLFEPLHFGHQPLVAGPVQEVGHHFRIQLGHELVAAAQASRLSVLQVVEA